MDDYGNGIPKREGEDETPEEDRQPKWLGYVPAAAFAVYALLLFLIFLAPVIPGTVNVYQSANVPPCTALIVFAALSLAAAGAGVAVLFLAPSAPLLQRIFTYLPFLFYFLIHSASCSLAGIATSVGANSPLCGLTISFSVLFALVHAGCLLLPRILKK